MNGEPRESKLGGRLVSKGLISEQDLEDALERQRADGRLLGEILVDMGAVGEDDVRRVLGEMFEVEEVALENLVPDDGAVDVLPREIAERHTVLPLALSDNTLIAATPDPFSLQTKEDVERVTRRVVDLRSAPTEAVQRAIRRYYPEVSAAADFQDRIQELVQRSLEQVRRRGSAEEELSEAAPVVELIDSLLHLSLLRRASDLHVEPGPESLRTRLRVDGTLRDGPELPKELQSVVNTRLKLLGGMDISESRLPQDGRSMVELEDEQADLRLSSFPTVHGESLVVRLLQKGRLVMGLEELGMTGEQLAVYRRLVGSPHGILLITGPTGSGKTTSLYSTLSELRSTELNIMTIEDPVEYELAGIRQSQINRRAGLTFANGLRSMLRQDPDVVLVGEIRDRETMDIAIRAALTGHLVFSTLHTRDAVGAVPRLLDMGAEPYLLSSSLLGVVAQRLVRLNCPHCAEARELTDAERRELSRLGFEPDPGEVEGLRRGTGCPECDGSGYRGRIGIFETLEVTERVGNAILKAEDAGNIRRLSREEGMITMLEAGLARAFAGETTVEEVLRVAV